MSHGRPKGSQNISETVDVEASRCPSCGSTERGEYRGRTVQEYEGIYNSQPYTAIVRRRCVCLNCGQWRVDRTFENNPKK